MGEMGDQHIAAGKAVGDVMGGGLAIDGGGGGQDHFLDGPLTRTVDQRRNLQILGPDAVERRQHAAEHVIAPAIGGAALQRPEIRDILDNANQPVVAARITA